MKQIGKSYTCILLSLFLIACGGQSETTVNETESVSEETKTEEKESAQEESVAERYENTTDGEHAILVDGNQASYTNIVVEKSGEASGDEADFYGENAAVFATNAGELTIEGSEVHTNGTHANAIFSYGEGTVVNVIDTTIETEGNCSGGLMTTGGGTMNASDLTIHTSGNSSAAIRSDRGGGIVTVTGGSYTTDGKGSPVIYSTADITVNDARLESTSSQGIVVEGKNSVTLNEVELIADNNSKNSDKSDYYQAIMIYQSMSGDAAQGEATFTMNDGSLTNHNGDIFFVNNTFATINLKNVDIDNLSDGIFARIVAAGWGNEGSNGGHVTLNASEQVIEGTIVVDDISTLNLYLKEESDFQGAINTEGLAGEVYVEIEEGSTWTLSEDTYITGLTCKKGAIDLNGYQLYVNGKEYQENSSSNGQPIEVVISEEAQPGPNGQPPEKPGDGKEPPVKPEGEKPRG